jgi:hypothetical protein
MCCPKVPHLNIKVKKAKISPLSPKTEFGDQNQYDRVIFLYANSVWTRYFLEKLLGIRKIIGIFSKLIPMD